MEQHDQTLSSLPLALAGCISIGLSNLVFFLDESIVQMATGEDGLIENLTAVFFLLASACFAFLYAKDSHGNNFGVVRTRRNVFFLLLCMAFFFGAGEEVSWGQRIFQIETPELFAQNNVQHEINIHNLAIFHGLEESGERKSFWKLLLNIDRLFSVFWFSYCVLVPIVFSLNRSFRALIVEVNLPVVPIPIGILFLANYVISKGLGFLEMSEGWLIVETKEYNTAFLFLMVSIYFVKQMRAAAKLAHASANSV